MDAISIRMEHETKVAFSEFCKYIGLSVSSVINMFAKKVINENRIPFELTGADPFWSEENQCWLKQQIAEAKAGKVTEHELYEVED